MQKEECTLADDRNRDITIRNIIYMSDKDAQYDKIAKEIMGNKNILAYVLVNTVEEFYGMDPKEAVTYIEGEPYIGIVPTDPGLTNAVRMEEGKKINGLNTENSELNEGVIYFDILFFVRTRDQKSKIIVNIEIQKDEPSEYGILNRAIFYVCREISSQKEREFVKSEYNNIKQVYSIWLCLNQIDDSLQYIYFTKEELKGKMTWKGRMKIPNIIMIGLSKKLPELKKENMLHRFLGTLLSNQLEAQEKIEILEKEYGFPVEEKMKGEIDRMCNLSQGIRESGRVEGRIEGENCAMKLIEKLMAKGRMEDCHRVIKDGAYRRQLMQEFNIR